MYNEWSNMYVDVKLLDCLLEEESSLMEGCAIIRQPYCRWPNSKRLWKLRHNAGQRWL